MSKNSPVLQTLSLTQADVRKMMWLLERPPIWDFMTVSIALLSMCLLVVSMEVKGKGTSPPTLRESTTCLYALAAPMLGIRCTRSLLLILSTNFLQAQDQARPKLSLGPVL